MENSTSYYKIQGFSSTIVTVSILVLCLQCILCQLHYLFLSRISILIPLVLWGQRMDFKCGVVDVNMKMEAACCSKTMVYIYQIRKCHILEDSKFHLCFTFLVIYYL